MPFLGLCNGDPILGFLAKTLKATPVLVPERRIQPVCVLAHHGARNAFLGPLIDILVGKPTLNVPMFDSPMAELSGKETRSVGIDVGLEVLGNFLGGFKVPSAGISACFTGARTVSFSFSNVSRHYVESTKLGGFVAGRSVEKKHPTAAIFFPRGQYKFLVIDSVITSSDFSIMVTNKSTAGFKLDIPAIQNIVTKASVGVQAEAASELGVTFRGKPEEALTFAFTCVEFILDDSGLVTELLPPKAVTKAAPTRAARPKVDVPGRFIITKEPGLLTLY